MSAPHLRGTGRGAVGDADLKIAIVAALAATLLIAAAAAEAAPETDIMRQAAMAKRFDPFDANVGAEWEQAFPSPRFQTLAAGDSEPVTLELKRGAYMIVVLCNCDSMDVTLLAPDGSPIAPLKSNQQSAMYSVDAAADGAYLTGIDMSECAEASCDLAVKAYRKK